MKKLRKPLGILLALTLAFGGVMVGHAEDQPFGADWPKITSFSFTGDGGLEPDSPNAGQTIVTYKDQIRIVNYTELKQSTVSDHEDHYLAGEIIIPAAIDVSAQGGAVLPEDKYAFAVSGGTEANRKAETPAIFMSYIGSYIPPAKEYDGYSPNCYWFEEEFTGELKIYEESGKSLYYLIKPENTIYLRGMSNPEQSVFTSSGNGPLSLTGPASPATAAASYDPINYDIATKTFTASRERYIPGRQAYRFNLVPAWGCSAVSDTAGAANTKTYDLWAKNNVCTFSVKNRWKGEETFTFKLVDPRMLIVAIPNDINATDASTTPGKSGEYSFGTGSVNAHGYDFTPESIIVLGTATANYRKRWGVIEIWAGDTVVVTPTPEDEESGTKIKEVELYISNDMGVKDESAPPIDVTIRGATFSFTMPDRVVTVGNITFWDASEEKEITKVELLVDGESVGTVAGVGTSDIMITLPQDTPEETLSKIKSGSGAILKIVPSDNATVAQENGWDDTLNGTSKWSNGEIFCYMPLNEQVNFTVTAQDRTTKDYTIKIAYTPPPFQISTIFDSSQGDVSIKVDGSDATEAKVGDTVAIAATPMSGYKFVKWEITPTVTFATGSATSASASFTMPETDVTVKAVFEEDEGGTTGTYSITASAPSGGTLTPSKTKANEGDTITVTATPNSGKKMAAGTLTYTLAVTGGETINIDETTNQFVMPACNITITCKWEDVSGGSSVTDTSPVITAFTVKGVDGAVNNTTGKITITLPYGTNVKNLTPVIATKNMASISPDSGVAVDFSSAVTYTLTGTDGSTRSYIVQVYVASKSTAEDLWDQVFDPIDTTPWWEYAEDYSRRSGNRFPNYWE